MAGVAVTGAGGGEGGEGCVGGCGEDMRVWEVGGGGMEIVRVAVARWQSQRRGRRMDMIGVRECECTVVVLKWKFTYGVVVLVWRWKLEVS